MLEETSAEILTRYCGGDEQAADAIFHRYLSRLTLLARSRLSPRLASRTDPEDVVLSAYRSFFIGARNGQFQIQRSGDLWRLLVSITLHKLYRQVRFHHAEVRTVFAEQTAVDPNLHLAREPSPDEVLLFSDEMENFMSKLEPCARRVFELRLQDETVTSIAVATGRSERTIRRILKTIRQSLADRLEQNTRD